MGKMNQISQCIDDLNTASKALASAAYGLGVILGGMTPVTEPETPKQETPKPPTLEDVRGILADISRNGKTAAVKELLGKYGGEKLSEIPPGRYSELLKDAEGIANG